MLGIFTVSRAKAKIILSLLLITILIIIGFYSLITYQKNLLINTRFEQLVSFREGLKSHINSIQKNLGIDYMQGYEYGKPKNIKDLNSYSTK
jgi:hypothetical protein